MTKANCPSRHYANNQECQLPKGHREIWHQTTHPTRGTLLRFRQALGTRWTQEWNENPDGDAGMWVTLHYVSSENQGCDTPTVTEDLDQRIAAALSGHVNMMGFAGPIGCCSCGVQFVDSHWRHVAREVSLIVRVFFDGGREQGLREASDVLRAKRCGETPPGFAAAASAVERHAADRE